MYRTASILAFLLMASSPVAVVAQNTPTAMLPYGTPVVLELNRDINSRDAILGEQLFLQVVEDVTLNGRVVIPRGSRAVAEVSNVKRKSGFGVSGKIETRLLFVRVGDHMVRLSGRMRDRGQAGGVATAAVMLLSLPLGAVVTGTSGDLHAGTHIIGYLDEDVPVSFTSIPTTSPVQAGAAVALNR